MSSIQEGHAALLLKGGALADSNLFILTSTVAMCAVITRNYRLVKEPDQRRRIKWVIYGSIVGIVPGLLNTALLLLVTLAFPNSESTNKLLTLSNAIVNFMTVAIPLSIGYAVLKHRAFDVNIVIRRGLQHLFAKQALRLILALPVAGLVYTIIANRNLSLTAIVTGNPVLLLLIAAAGLSLKFRRQLIRWIDRRFFREAYSQEQILLNLIEKIKELDSLPELSQLVSREVEAAIHPQCVYVFYRGDEKRDLTLGYSSGGKSRDLRIDEDSETAAMDAAVKECPACGACYDSTSTVCAKDQRELTLSLPVERTIDQKYRLDQMIGRGGMGAVYEATDLRLNRKVAIKIMLGSMFGDRTALRRFEREAQTSARLEHTNIITVYDYGSIRTEGAYLVMELVRGPTLRSELKRMGQLDAQTAAAWFTQMLEGVKAAHQSGVIHRDLKPENVLIARHATGPERIELLDFGLARISQLDPSNPETLTTPGTVMGTFAYMSPEQILGEEVDERGDIFALGVMVVEALTGSRPFLGRTSTELIGSILRSPFHLKGEAVEVKQLDSVLQKCLAKDRGQRFVSAAAMQQELIPAIEGCPPFAPIPTPAKEMRNRDDATRTLRGLN